MYYLAVTLLLAFVCVAHQAGQTQLGSSCNAEKQCGTVAVCSQKSHICKCFYGYTPEPDHINCRPQSCSTESDCTTKYSAHSICSTGKTCQCDIPSGWTFDLETLNSCLPMKVPLNQPCRNGTECSTFAYCDQNKDDQPKCKCKFGYKLDLKSEINCTPIDSCQSDADCVDPHAHCDPKSAFPCSCNYEAGYMEDFDHGCIPRSQTIGQNCSKNSKINCGMNAACDLSTSDSTTNTNGTCKCLKGFVSKSNQMDCYRSAGHLTNFYSIQLAFLIFVLLKTFIF